MKNKNFCLMLSGLLWMGISFCSQELIKLQLTAQDTYLIGMNCMEENNIDCRECLVLCFENAKFHKTNLLTMPRAYILEQGVTTLRNGIEAVIMSGVDTRNHKVTMQFKLKSTESDRFDRLCEFPVYNNWLATYSKDMHYPEGVDFSKLEQFYNIELVKICPDILPHSLPYSPYTKVKIPMQFRLKGSNCEYKDTVVERGVAFACKDNSISSYEALFVQIDLLKYFVQHKDLQTLKGLIFDVLCKDTSMGYNRGNKQYLMEFVLKTIFDQQCEIKIDHDLHSAISNLIYDFPRDQEVKESDISSAQMDDFQVKVVVKNQNNKAMIRTINSKYDDLQCYIDQRVFFKKQNDGTYVVFMTPTISGACELCTTGKDLQHLLNEMEKVDQLNTVSIGFCLSGHTDMWVGTYSIEVNEKNIAAIKQCIEVCDNKEADFETLKSFAQNMTCSITDVKPYVVKKQAIGRGSHASSSSLSLSSSSAATTTRPLAGGKSVTAQQQQTAKQTKVAEQVSGPIKSNGSLTNLFFLGGGVTLVAIVVLLYKYGYVALPGFLII